MPQSKITQKASEEILPLFTGKTTTITLPSGREVKIRETNGDDDELLSSWNDSADGSNIAKFLSSIVLEDSFLKGKPSVGEINNWPINDKYGLLFKQRLFVHGSELKFRAICTEESCKHEDIYNEDLTQWDTDLAKEEPKNSRALALYPEYKKEIEFTISSGKKLKYELLTGELEKRARMLQDPTRNSPLVIRNLQVQNQGKYILVTHFAGFSSREMTEIRNHIASHDKQFDPMVHFACSNPACGKEYNVSLFSISAFLFPEEEMI